MNFDLLKLLEKLRKNRGFDAETYIQAKTSLINQYFIDNGIKVCIIGVSGGIDSAVVVALIKKISKISNTSIEQVIPALLPVYNNGATNQDIALDRGKEVAKAFGLNAKIVDLSASHQILKNTVDSCLDIESNDWSAGQLVSYIRTPALYYLATLFQQHGKKAVVCGTTNRDEGAYIGFFGKASDGMVDLQIISDLHKSEVYKVAEALSVPQSVMKATPTGDTYNGETDQEMIGTCYDFVELYQLFLSLPTEDLKTILINELPEHALAEFTACAELLKKRHNNNLHKYLDGTPAIHFDVYERAVPGGWQTRSNIKSAIVNTDKFVGFFELENKTQNCFKIDKSMDDKEFLFSWIEGFENSVCQIKNFINKSQINAILSQINTVALVPADKHGYPLSEKVKKHSPSSYRATTYNQDLANYLFIRLLQTQFPVIKTLTEYTPTDGHPHKYWRFVGVNPVFRFILYPENGSVVPHYDAGYDFKDDKSHTLMSVLIYLTDINDNEGGITRLLWDKQRHLPINERDFTDHENASRDFDSLSDIKPEAGTALILDHRLLHEATPLCSSKRRIVIRTDLIFEKCGIPKNQISLSNNLQSHLLEKLGLSTWKSTKQIDNAYCAIKEKSNDKELNLAWQILRDPFYAKACSKFHDIQQIYDAGFFEDKRSYKEASANSLNWMVTPIYKIDNNLKNSHRSSHTSLAVLVSTGGFSPIHSGHIEMMEIAKNTLENRGIAVLGGYLCPDHDDYINYKNADYGVKADERLIQCESMVKDSNWLMIDPWALRYQSTSVNFTTIVDRLSSYISAHIKSTCTIEVIYVCGGDNIHLAMSFIERGRCVVVPRDGYEKKLFEYKENKIKDNLRIILCNEKPHNISSSQLREQQHKSNKDFKTNKSLIIKLRNEREWPLQIWKKKKNYKQICKSYKFFQAHIITLLEKSYGKPVKIEINDISLQEKSIGNLNNLKHNVISLDPCTKSKFNIEISRYFGIASHEQNSMVFGPRPNMPSISEQILLIPKGDYILLDDDIYTGGTIKHVHSILPSGYNVIDNITFFNMPNEMLASNNLFEYETCDLRDFLFGGHGSGLLINLPNGLIGAAPYILPYVRPVYRLSLPSSKEVIFSLKALRINLDFFASLKPTLRISDMSQSFINLANYIGFSNETTMEQWCKWHIELLDNCSGANNE